MKQKILVVLSLLVLGAVLFGAFQIGGRDGQPKPATTTSQDIALAIPQDPAVSACLAAETGDRRNATGNDAAFAFANASMACGDPKGAFLAFYDNDGTPGDITSECASGWWDSASEQEQVGILAGFYLLIAGPTETLPISTEQASDNLVEACT